jgi:hypothetical protein
MPEYRLVSEVAHDLKMYETQVKDFATAHGCLLRPRWWFSLPPGGEVYEVDWPSFRKAFNSWSTEDRLNEIVAERQRLRDCDSRLQVPTDKPILYPQVEVEIPVLDYRMDDAFDRQITKIETLLTRLKMSRRRRLSR